MNFRQSYFTPKKYIFSLKFPLIPPLPTSPRLKIINPLNSEGVCDIDNRTEKLSLEVLETLYYHCQKQPQTNFFQTQIYMHSLLVCLYPINVKTSHDPRQGLVMI